MKLSVYTSEFRRNWQLAYPVILGMLGQTLVQFCDNIMVGQLGTAELAAVSLANSFFYIGMSLCIGFSTAITPLIAEASGAKQKEYGRRILKHGLLLLFAISVVLFLFLLNGLWGMNYMGQNPEVKKLATPYLIIVALSIIPMGQFQGFKQFSDGMSHTKYAMYATIVAVTINIVLNYLLIFGKFGFPKMGVLGAAIGTLIARCISVLCIYYLLKKDKELRFYVIGWKWQKFTRDIFKKIAKIGIPSSMQMFFEVMIFTAAIWMSGMLGKNPQAANQIAINMASMTFMVAVGLSVTATVRVGNQYGRRDFKDLRRVGFSVLLMSVLIESVFMTIFLIWNSELPKIYLDEKSVVNFADNQEVIIISAKLLIVTAFFQLADGIQVVCLGALRGMQDVNMPTWITLASYWLIAFPVCLYLGFYTPLASVGIWIGLLVGLTVAAIFLLIRFNYLSKKLIAEGSYSL